MSIAEREAEMRAKRAEEIRGILTDPTERALIELASHFARCLFQCPLGDVLPDTRAKLIADAREMYRMLRERLLEGPLP